MSPPHCAFGRDILHPKWAAKPCDEPPVMRLVLRDGSDPDAAPKLYDVCLTDMQLLDRLKLLDRASQFDRIAVFLAHPNPEAP